MRYSILFVLICLVRLSFSQVCLVDCGGTVDLVGNTNPDYTCLWNTGVTACSFESNIVCFDTNFSVTVTDECGVSGVDVEPVQVRLPQITIFKDEVNCLLIIQSTGCNTPNYQWTSPSGIVYTNSQTIQNVDECGIWTAEIIDCNSCVNCTAIATTDFQGDCCEDCDCTANLVVEEDDCQLDIIVSGTGCDNYQMGVLKWGNDNCTGGNCNLYSGLTAQSTTLDIDSGNACGNFDDPYTGYQILLTPDGSSCNPVLSNCDIMPEFAGTGFDANCSNFNINASFNCGSFDGVFVVDDGCDCIPDHNFNIQFSHNIQSATLTNSCSSFNVSITTQFLNTVAFLATNQSGAPCGTPPGCANLPASVGGGVYNGFEILTVVDACGEIFEYIIAGFEC